MTFKVRNSVAYDSVAEPFVGHAKEFTVNYNIGFHNSYKFTDFSYNNDVRLFYTEFGGIADGISRDVVYISGPDAYGQVGRIDLSEPTSTRNTKNDNIRNLSDRGAIPINNQVLYIRNVGDVRRISGGSVDTTVAGDSGISHLCDSKGDFGIAAKEGADEFSVFTFTTSISTISSISIPNGYSDFFSGAVSNYPTTPVNYVKFLGDKIVAFSYKRYDSVLYYYDMNGTLINSVNVDFSDFGITNSIYHSDVKTGIDTDDSNVYIKIPGKPYILVYDEFGNYKRKIHCGVTGSKKFKVFNGTIVILSTDGTLAICDLDGNILYNGINNYYVEVYDFDIGGEDNYSNADRDSSVYYIGNARDFFYSTDGPITYGQFLVGYFSIRNSYSSHRQKTVTDRKNSKVLPVKRTYSSSAITPPTLTQIVGLQAEIAAGGSLSSYSTVLPASGAHAEIYFAVVNFDIGTNNSRYPTSFSVNGLLMEKMVDTSTTSGRTDYGFNGAVYRFDNSASTIANGSTLTFGWTNVGTQYFTGVYCFSVDRPTTSTTDISAASLSSATTPDTISVPAGGLGFFLSGSRDSAPGQIINLSGNIASLNNIGDIGINEWTNIKVLLNATAANYTLQDHSGRNTTANMTLGFARASS